MTRLKPWLIAGLLALSPLSGQAQSVTLSPVQMHQTARAALAAHNPALALALADALLKVSPDQFGILILKSRAERDLGKFSAARKSARRAWKLAKTPNAKFAASLITAQALSSAGSKTRAQIWLRRASDHATTPAQQEQLRRDFNYVRATNPWRVNLGFGMNPSSNVNGGSSKDTITLFGFPFALSDDAKALSGFQAFATADISYRLKETQRSRTSLGFQAYHRETWLSDDAKEAAPTAKGGDFRYTSAALTFKHQHIISNKGTRLDLSARLGRNWYGNAPLSNFAGLGADVHWRLSAGKRLSLRTRFDLQDHQDDDTPNTYIGSLGVRYSLPALGHRWTLSGDYQQSFSENLSREYKEFRAGVDVALGKPIAGMDVSMGVQASTRSYDVSRYAADGRHDTSIEANAAITLNTLGHLGFSPVVTLRHRHTNSNVSLYSTNETALGLSLTSNF